MKLYKTSFYTEQLGSQGCEWHTTKRDAFKAQRDFCAAHKDDADDLATASVEEVDFTSTRAGILRLLRDHAQHANNG